LLARHGGDARNDASQSAIPAEAGIGKLQKHVPLKLDWVPTFVGMTGAEAIARD
jgi:hypothetical protein